MYPNPIHYIYTQTVYIYLSNIEIVVINGCSAILGFSSKFTPGAIRLVEYTFRSISAQAMASTHSLPRTVHCSRRLSGFYFILYMYFYILFVLCFC